MCYDDEEGENGHAFLDASMEITELAFPEGVAVEVIHKIDLQTVERGKMEIGEYLLDAVFRGNVDEVLSHNPYKAEAFPTAYL
jgi:hypothetical protein